MEKLDCKYIADAQDMRKKYRLAVLEDSLEEVMDDFRIWTEEHQFKEKDVWYCHVYEQTEDSNKLSPVAELTLLPGGEVKLELKDTLTRKKRKFHLLHR